MTIRYVCTVRTVEGYNVTNYRKDCNSMLNGQKWKSRVNQSVSDIVHVNFELLACYPVYTVYVIPLRLTYSGYR